MIRIIFLSILLIGSVKLYSEQDTLQQGSSEIPSADLRTFDGSIVNSRDLLDDTVPIILSFWATWCRPCIQELSAINDEMVDWKKEINFRVVAVSIDDARTTHAVRNFVNARGWDFEVYLDPNSDFRHLMNVSQPPHTFIISRGKVVFQHTSYSEGDEFILYDELVKNQ